MLFLSKHWNVSELLLSMDRHSLFVLPKNSIIHQKKNSLLIQKLVYSIFFNNIKEPIPYCLNIIFILVCIERIT